MTARATAYFNPLTPCGVRRRHPERPRRPRHFNPLTPRKNKKRQLSCVFVSSCTSGNLSRFPNRKKAKRGCFTYGDTAPLTGYLLQAELLVEAFNTSASVNQLLLAGIERVALGADFNSDILLSRPGLEHGTTSTANGGLLIIGMDSLLHVCSPLSVSSQGAKRPQNLKPDYYTMGFPRLQPQNSIFFLADPRKSAEFPLDFCRNCGLLPTPVPCTI